MKTHLALISNALVRAANAVETFVLVLVLASVATCARAQDFQVLYSFPASSNNGFPVAGVIRSADNLYGTANGGPICGAPSYGFGSVFQISSRGTATVIHEFGGVDGACPMGELLRGRDGNLYGTTAAGGSYNSGVVFKLDSNGVETVLHDFSGLGEGADGCAPEAGLVQDKVGSLYGTTVLCGSFGVGTVFKIDPSGNETVLHSFSGPDGVYPTGLMLDGEGNLYGNADAVLYRISATGAFSVLHTFADCVSFGTPISDNERNLYGTGTCRGTSYFGIVWKISKNGTVTVLHKFTAPERAAPSDHGLILDKEGNLYGLTLGDGGLSNVGTVYKLSPDGAVILLHTFTYASAVKEGAYPFGRLTMDSEGNLYGTTQYRGRGGMGTVWKLKP